VGIIDAYKHNWAVTRYSTRQWLAFGVVALAVALVAGLAAVLVQGDVAASAVLIVAASLFGIVCFVQALRTRR
jgi:hypothetical protein